MEFVIGFGAAVGVFVVYLVLRKVPGAYAGLKAWWTKADTEVKSILTDLQGRVTALEGKVAAAPKVTPPAA